jgi:hypothetical protein
MNCKLRLKEGVDLCGTSAEMLQAMPVVAGVFFALGCDCTVTSGLDGDHSARSYHYDGDAQDYRVWDVMGSFEKVAKQIRQALVLALPFGTYFDVMPEWRTDDDGNRIPSHIHVEFDRRRWDARTY